MGETRVSDRDAEVCVIYEDAHLLAVAKPAGMVTHPAYRHPNGTLVDAVFARQADHGEGRPWLLHRLDRETSGIVLFAKTEQARRGLVRQFERHSIQKQYVALLAGVPQPMHGEIAAPLRRDPADRRRTIIAADGQAATTRYYVLAALAGAALALVEPQTGRTHQIRAHLAAWGAPLYGDVRYLPPEWAAEASAPRTMLHAWRLGFTDPITHARCLLTAPLPDDLRATATRLGLGPALAALERQDGALTSTVVNIPCGDSIAEEALSPCN